MYTFELRGDTLWLSPYFFTAMVALEEKAATYTLAPVAMERGAQRDAEYQAASITGRVPALRHGEFVLAESSAMAEYIEELLPTPPLLGSSVQERARVRQLMSWIRSDATLPLRTERSTHGMFYPTTHAELSEAGRATSGKFVAVCTHLGLLAGREFAVGAAFTLADADLSMFAMRLILAGDALPDPIVAYAKHHWARPSIAKFVEHPRGPLVPYVY
jgi:glutathione S-transferase